MKQVVNNELACSTEAPAPTKKLRDLNVGKDYCPNCHQHTWSAKADVMSVRRVGLASANE